MNSQNSRHSRHTPRKRPRKASSEPSSEPSSGSGTSSDGMGAFFPDNIPTPAEVFRMIGHGIKPEDAWKCLRSQISALYKLARSHAPNEPEIQAIFNSSNPTKALSEYLGQEQRQLDWNKELPQMLKKLMRYSKRTENSIAKIDSALVGLWNDDVGSLAPLCLLSDDAILTTFEGAINISTEAMIRQRIKRLGLFRPTAPRIGIRTIQKNGKQYSTLVYRKKRNRPSKSDMDSFLQSKYPNWPQEP